MRSRPAPVAVVTDSTASLPPQGAQRAGISVVPLHVVVDGLSHLEGVDLPTARLVAALRDGRPVSTSQPSPEAFMEAYAHAAASGAREIVSVHIADELSGTLQAAQVAVQSAPVPVRLVDSRTVGMGLGFAALAAAAVASEGGSASDCVEAATRVAGSCCVMFTVATLDHLRRGGRMSAAQAAVGTALGLRPVLRIRDGVVEVEERVRSTARARERLIARVLSHAEGRGQLDLAVHQLDNPVEAQRLATELRTMLGDQVRNAHLSEISAVVGAHAGPGLLAVVLADA